MPYANNNNDQALRKRNQLALTSIRSNELKDQDKDDRTEVYIELCKSIIKILRNKADYVTMYLE